MPQSTAIASVEYFPDCPTGTVEQYFADGRVHWSDEVYRVHGYERGDVVPTAELGLAHIEPADRQAVQAFWQRVLRGGGPVSTYSTILDVRGGAHKVLISADLIIDGTEPVGAWALVVDLTRSIHADTHRLANEAVAASAVRRAVIEQAKGILMGRAGMTPREAFDKISSYSQHTNRKVVVIAQNVIDRAVALTREEQHQPRSNALDDLFGGL